MYCVCVCIHSLANAWVFLGILLVCVIAKEEKEDWCCNAFWVPALYKITMATCMHCGTDQLYSLNLNRSLIELILSKLSLCKCKKKKKLLIKSEKSHAFFFFSSFKHPHISYWEIYFIGSWFPACNCCGVCSFFLFCSFLQWLYSLTAGVITNSQSSLVERT